MQWLGDVAGAAVRRGKMTSKVAWTVGAVLVTAYVIGMGGKFLHQPRPPVKRRNKSAAKTHAGQAVLEEARRIARQELATDDPSYASYDDNTTTTTTWPRDPGAVFNTTPDGNHVVVVTIKTPLTGGKPEDPKTTNDTPPASSQGPQSHPLPEEDEDHDGYSHNNDTTNMPVDDHVAAPATDTATRPATPEEATLSDAATAGATTASNDYTMPNGRPASPFLEASRRHQEDTTPAPLQTTTLEEALSETLPNSAFHIDDDPRGTAPAPAGESLAEEEATSCPPPAPTTADLPAGDAVAPEAPAASWGSGTMPSTRPSTTGEQQEETVQKIPDAKNATNACAAPESAPAAPATNAEAVATLTTPACVTKATPAITLDPAPSSTTTSGRSSCSSSEDVEVRADSNTPASQKTASRQQKAGVYIVPQRRYYDNMGDSWCFSGGRPGCSAAAAVVALLEMGLTPADEGLRQLAAAYTLPQLRQLAALRFYGSDAKVASAHQSSNSTPASPKAAAANKASKNSRRRGNQETKKQRRKAKAAAARAGSSVATA